MNTQIQKALEMAIEALETYVPHYGFDANWHKAINACKEALATNEDSLLVQPAQEPKCSKNPDAPHGFCRDASHSAGRYVCECEGWEAEQPAQEPVSNEAVRAEFRSYVDTNLDVDNGFRFVDFLEGVRYAEKAHGIGE